MGHPTHVRRADYYVCKNRRLTRAGEGCRNPFMRREKLEPALDSLFSERLTDCRLLREIADRFMAGGDEKGMVAEARCQSELQALRAKRERILGAYFDGLIQSEERDRRLRDIERDEKLYGEMLLRSSRQLPLSASQLAQVFAPFHEWDFLSREQKRRLLGAITPEIHVENYRVLGLSILADAVNADSSRNEVSHNRAGYLIATAPKLYIPLGDIVWSPPL